MHRATVGFGGRISHSSTISAFGTRFAANLRINAQSSEVILSPCVGCSFSSPKLSSFERRRHGGRTGVNRSRKSERWYGRGWPRIRRGDDQPYPLGRAENPLDERSRSRRFTTRPIGPTDRTLPAVVRRRRLVDRVASATLRLAAGGPVDGHCDVVTITQGRSWRASPRRSSPRRQPTVEIDFGNLKRSSRRRPAPARCVQWWCRPCRPSSVFAPVWILIGQRRTTAPKHRVRTATRMRSGISAAPSVGCPGPITWFPDRRVSAHQVRPAILRSAVYSTRGEPTQVGSPIRCSPLFGGRVCRATPARIGTNHSVG